MKSAMQNAREIVRLVSFALSANLVRNSSPFRYVPPTLMDRNLYWKVTLILVLLAANNLDTLGQIMWKDYDTVRSLMEMLMTK